MTQQDQPDEVVAARLRPVVHHPAPVLGVQYFSMNARVIGGRITLLCVTGTPNDWQRPVINAGNPRALLDLFGYRGNLVGGIPANK